MSDEEVKDAAALVRTLLDVAPGENFEIVKVEQGGKRVRYPVRVQLLRVEEDHQVLEAAQAYAKSRSEAPREYGDLYKEGQAVALLTKALRRPEKRDRGDGTHYYPPVFTSEEQLRQSFTAPEMAMCISFYEIVRSKYGAIQPFSEEDVDRWVRLIGDPMRGAFFLAALDSLHWPNLLLRLCQERASQLPPISPDTSASDPESSDSGTGSFTELPEGYSAGSSESLPTDHVLSKEEAAAMAEKIYGKK